MEKTLHQVLLVLVRLRAEAFMSGCQIGVSIARELDYATPFSPPQSVLKFRIADSPCDSVGRPAAAMLNQRGTGVGVQEAAGTVVAGLA